MRKLFLLAATVALLGLQSIPSFADTLAGVSIPGTTCASADPQNSSCSGSYSYSFTGGSESIEGSAIARETFGNVGIAGSIKSTALDSVGDNEIDGYVQSSATFWDIINITSAAPVSGSLRFFYSIDGSTSLQVIGAFNDPYNNGTVDVRPYLYDSALGARSTDPVYGSTQGFFDSPFQTYLYDPNTGTWSGSIDFGMGLVGYASCMSGSANGELATCASNFDFYHTMQVTGLSPVDANGNTIDGLSLVSQSGTDYNNVPNSTPVPEPSTFLLFGSSLAGISSVLRRSRRMGNPSH